MDKAVHRILPKSAVEEKIVSITVNYTCISGSSRNPGVQTARGARMDHPTPEIPEYKQVFSTGYAATCDVPQGVVTMKS